MVIFGAAILLIICQFAVNLCLLVLIRRYLSRKESAIRQEIEETVRDFVSSPSEGKPSKLAEYLQAMGSVVGSGAAHSLMASLQQSKSSMNQVANGIVSEMQGPENPILSFLSGKRGKGSSLIQLANLLGPMLNKGNNGPSNGTEMMPRKHRE